MIANLVNDLEYSEAAYWSKLYQAKLKLKAYKTTIAGGMACSLPQIDILAFNRVVGLGLSIPVTLQDIDSIIDFFHQKGAKRCFVQIAPGAQPDALEEMLIYKGFKYHNSWVKMAMPIFWNADKATNQLTILKIGREKAEDYGSIIVKSFDWPPELKDFFAASVEVPGYTHYLALKDTRPIAAAALHIHGKTASMAIAGTLPEFRGLGAQSGLLLQRWRDALQMGCTYLVSETGVNSPKKPNPSYLNMLKIGFIEQYLRRNYIFEF